MRKHLLFFTLLMLQVVGVFAQQRPITGRVVDETAQPVSGASVTIKGTKIGASANDQGAFRINAKTGDILVVSAIGIPSIEVKVTSSSNLSVSLSRQSQTLSEVVVTGAYNTKRQSRSVSYNAQVVTGEQMNTIRQTNLNAALVGKVTGIQFRGQSSVKLGNTGSVQLGGYNGLGGATGVIYVVDGTILPDINSVNLDDVESLSVLQGPAAGAQFGSQGANGAIVITLKKGKTNTRGLGVSVNLGAQIDKVYILPNYQNAYSGGSSQDMTQYKWTEGQPEQWKALDGKYYHNYEDDASWGPRMTGQEYIPWYAWYDGTKYSYKTAKLTPQPSNAKDFYNTGVTSNNTVSISNATDRGNFRFSYGNVYTKGLLPQSSLSKNTLNFSFAHNLNQHITLGANINYETQNLNGLINSDGYGNQSSGSFNSWFHRDLDMGIMKELQNLKTPEGVYASWNHNNPGSYSADNPVAFYGGNYWYNFYTYFNNYKDNTRNDRLYGDISLTYKINNDLRIKATYRKQQNTSYEEATISSDLQTSATQTGVKGFYYTYESFSNREDYELLASYTKKIKDIQLEVSTGSDFFRWTSKYNSANTNTGLTIPNFYAISNSVDQPSVGNYRTAEAYNAVYGIASAGYKNLVFLDGTLRNDWYSTLPASKNYVLSKSAGASFVFSDLLRVPAINYAKLRLSWGELPQALGTTVTTFGAYRYPGSTYSVGGNQWRGNIVTSTPDQLVNPNIRGAVSTRKEIALQMSFLKSRLGFTATFWDGTQKAFPYALTTNGTSGYSSYLTNIGEIKQKSVEFQFNAKPFWKKNFMWEFNATWSRLIDNTVVSLSDGTTEVTQTAVEYSAFYGNTPNVYMIKGMKSLQLWGNGIKTINGKRVLNTDGSYVSDASKDFGSTLPLYTGGAQNSFQVLKNFVVNVNIDYQYGGKFFSLSNMWGSYSGLTARTATYNDKGNPIRDPVADGGGVHVVGVDADSKAVGYYVDAETYFHNLYSNKTMDDYVYDLSYIKLRELSVGYTLPLDKMGLGKIITNAVFSLVARNPVLIYAQTKDFDPSEISGVGTENGQYPGTRSFGFNLKVGF